MTVQTSIVIRTLNEAKHLENLMQGIHAQNYRDWEIVLVDSGSTDRTMDIAREYGAKIHHIPQNEFTFGRSLNLGCEKAEGEYLVFASGHVWPITNNWLGNLVQPFEEPVVAMVYGRQRGTDANRLCEIRDLQSQFGAVSHILIDEPRGNNGNAAIRKDLWLNQPFDESLPGLEDVDWARKSEKDGYRVYYAADAAVYHVHEETLRQVYRRYQREAIASKRMFPHNTFKLFDVAKGLPIFMLRDLLFGLSQKKIRKLRQVPSSRIAQFLGIYRGNRYQKQLGRDWIRELKIPNTFQQVIVDGPNSHSLQQAEIPQLEPDQVLVQMAYTNIDAGMKGRSNGYGENPASKYPYIPGSEFSGIVIKRGSKNCGLKEGQKVVGGGSNGGTFSEYLVATPDHLQKLPGDVPLVHGALVASLSSCAATLRTLETTPGHSVCIVGSGPLPNLCAQISRAQGLDVTVVDPDNGRLALLEKYDINTLTQLGVLDKFDYLIEASGDSEVLADLVDGSKPSAKVISLDVGSSKDSPTDGKVVSLPPEGQPDDWRTAINWIKKRTVSLDDHIAAARPLEDYEKAWLDLESGKRFNVLLSVSKDLESL